MRSDINYLRISYSPASAHTIPRILEPLWDLVHLKVMVGKYQCNVVTSFGRTKEETEQVPDAGFLGCQSPSRLVEEVKNSVATLDLLAFDIF